MTQTDQIKALLETGYPFTSEKIKKKTGIEPKMVSVTLTDLTKQGEIYIVGKARNQQNQSVNVYQMGKICAGCNTLFFKKDNAAARAWKRAKSCSPACARHATELAKNPNWTPSEYTKKYNHITPFGAILTGKPRQPRELNPQLVIDFIRGHYDHPRRIKMRQIRQKLMEQPA